MRVKCLAQERNTMSLPRARIQTTRSGDERTNHEATVPPIHHHPWVGENFCMKEKQEKGKNIYRIFIGQDLNGE